MEDLLNEVRQCNEILRTGGIILYPTDTIWGIGCDATNEEAVSKIYKLKRREDSKSMIVLLDSEAKLQSYVQEVPEAAWDLIEFSEKPLTIIYDHAKNLAKNVIAQDGSVGIRITKDEFCRLLIGRFRKPIVSTSANISGDEPPAGFSEIDKSIMEGVDYVVNLRQHEQIKVPPSTIIKIGAGGKFVFIRK